MERLCSRWWFTFQNPTMYSCASKCSIYMFYILHIYSRTCIPCYGQTDTAPSQQKPKKHKIAILYTKRQNTK